MKRLLYSLIRLSFFVIVLLAVSCKKDVSHNAQNEEVYVVSFKFSGFTSQVFSLKTDVKSAIQFASVPNNSRNYSEGYLYYWSFNNDNLLPDIRFNNQFRPTITYVNGEVPNSFVNSTYTHENFVAGRALTFAGAKDILIKMPIQDVIQVTGLGFDVGSPGTGPKDFEIYYSLNKGVLYDTLQYNNQFGNTNTGNQKHSYSYDLADKDIQADELWIKITPKAGERGTSGTFNENTGALRMDNLFLYGAALTSPSNNTIDKIHYFLFHKQKPDVILTGVKDLNGSDLLDISIPIGTYDICFISNTSNAELILPSNLTMANLYVGNTFSNAKADIFGYVGELVVSQVQTNQIALERLFSQVKIEFTDVLGLDQITKIVINQEHDPFFFSPFNATMTNPILDQTSVEEIDDFALNKQVVFNQFMGKLNTSTPVNYTVQVYGSNGVLRTLTLAGAMKSNMQMVFRGNILDVVEQNNTFSIVKNETWDGQQTMGF